MDEELIELIIPTDMRNLQFPSPEETTYWECRKNRTFFIDYEFGDDYMLMELGKTIVSMNISEKDIPKEDLKPIQLWIHSFGGDAYQNRAFRSILTSSRIPIITVAMGTCMSSGFDIFLGGTRRYVFNDSCLMCHAGYLTLSGSQSEVEDAQKNNKVINEKDKKYILSRTSIPEAIYKKKLKNDWYFTNEEIENYGIAKIITSFEEIV